MATFKLFQAALTDEQIAELNGPNGGWDAKSEFVAYSQIGMGGMGDRKPVDLVMNSAKLGMIVHVANIMADDLEDVYKIGNIGPEHAITRLHRMTSVSVGNVVADEDGNLFFCDNFGWTDITEVCDDFLKEVYMMDGPVV